LFSVIKNIFFGSSYYLEKPGFILILTTGIEHEKPGFVSAAIS